MNEIYDKFYRGVAEIDLSAIKNNAINLISLLPPGAESVAVIKADAYGHGAREVCDVLRDTVDAFAVATPGEAHDILPYAGKKDIYILGYVVHDEFAFCAQNGVIPTIFSYEDAMACSKVAQALEKTIRINIKVDTGMNRIGFASNEDSADDVLKISKLPFIEIYGVFTHFACADCADKSSSIDQTSRFERFITMCAEKGVNFKKIHSANSAAVLSHIVSAGNQYRLGISLYGYAPSSEVTPSVQLTPAMSLKSHVVFVKSIHAGEAVSYGHTFIADRDTEIATVPIGYADGYPRQLSNKGRVIINGRSAPIVGRICMDMFMVDVTEMNVSVGDEVILMGKSEDISVDAEEIASLTDTISYEVLCRVGKRIPRRYKK